MLLPCHWVTKVVARVLSQVGSCHVLAEVALDFFFRVLRLPLPIIIPQILPH
jgi:hypothetical protein